MATSIKTIYERAARKMGSITGKVGGPTSTNVVLKSLIGTTGDNAQYAGDLLWFLDSDAGSRERIMTQWVDGSGVAIFAPLSDLPVADSTFILSPRENYTLGEMDEAFYKACRDTWRTYRMVVPVTPNFRYQVLNNLSWLEGAGRVDAVFRSDSPLMLHNEDFSLWQDGPNEAPDSYSLEGDGTVTRISGGVRSLYAARVTSTSGTVRLVQGIPASLSQWITRRTFPVYIPIRAAAWAATGDSSKVRVFIRYTDNGVTNYVYTSYFDALNRPVFNNVNLTPTASMDDFEWGIEVEDGATVDVSFAGLMQNTLDFNGAYQIKDAGSQFYKEYQVNDVVRNVGGQPMIEYMNYPATWGQSIIYTRRQFPYYDPYADNVEDQYAEILEAGMLVYLLQAQKPNQDRARLDRVLAEMTSIWNRRNTNQLDLPVPRPPVQAIIGGI